MGRMSRTVRGYSIVTGDRSIARVEVAHRTEGNTVKVFFNGILAGTWSRDIDSIVSNPKDDFPQN